MKIYMKWIKFSKNTIYQNLLKKIQRIWIKPEESYLLKKSNPQFKASHNENSRPRSLQRWILSKFKEEITAVLFKFFQRIETAETLSNVFYETIITLRPKSNKEITRGKWKCNISHEHWLQNPRKNITNQIQQYVKMDNISWQSGIHFRNSRSV